MPSVPKHLRPRWRYLAIEVETWMGEAVEREALQATLWHATRSLLGDVQSATIELDLVRYTFEDGLGYGMLRVSRGRVDAVRAVLATVDAVDGTPVRLGVRGVSGTMKACEENYLGIDRQAVTHEIVTLDTVETRASVRAEAVDIDLETGCVGATNLDLT